MTQTQPAGNGIREIRLDKNLKQKFVAEKAKISIKTLQRMESGKTKINFLDLPKLADALGVPKEEILQAEGLLMTNNFTNQHGHNIGYIGKFKEANSPTVEKKFQNQDIKIDNLENRLQKIEELLEKVLSKV